MLRPMECCRSADAKSVQSHCALHPRMRQQALVIPGHQRGQSLPQLGALFAVRYATVHVWLRAWHDRGLARSRPSWLPPRTRTAGR
jgi:transposase